MLLERRTGEDSSECRTGPVIDLVKETRRHIQEIEQDLASYRLLDLVELPGLGQLVDLRERSVFLTSHGLEDLPGEGDSYIGGPLTWRLPSPVRPPRRPSQVLRRISRAGTRLHGRRIPPPGAPR